MRKSRRLQYGDRRRRAELARVLIVGNDKRRTFGIAGRKRRRVDRDAGGKASRESERDGAVDRRRITERYGLFERPAVERNDDVTFGNQDGGRGLDERIVGQASAIRAGDVGGRGSAGRTSQSRGQSDRGCKPEQRALHRCEIRKRAPPPCRAGSPRNRGEETWRTGGRASRSLTEGRCCAGRPP
jgi:hypothetical protein